MVTVSCPAREVKAAKSATGLPRLSDNAPMRPVVRVGVLRTYSRYADGRVEVTITRDGRVTFYRIEPISSDIGGMAFRWWKASERNGWLRECYDVLVNSTHDSCTCPGHCYTERECKQATADLLKLGVLKPAPASAASDVE